MLRVRVRFLLFYSELAPTDPSCNMLHTLLGQKKYEEAVSDEHPLDTAGVAIGCIGLHL